MVLNLQSSFSKCRPSNVEPRISILCGRPLNIKCLKKSKCFDSYIGIKVIYILFMCKIHIFIYQCFTVFKWYLVTNNLVECHDIKKYMHL